MECRDEETERQRQTDTHTNPDRQTDAPRQTDRQTSRQTSHRHQADSLTGQLKDKQPTAKPTDSDRDR